MSWLTPSLRQTRELVRGEIKSALGGAAIIGNSVLRVMGDAKAGLAHLVLRYIDWLARQLMPDTAETEWLGRHGNIWLTNADGSIGRKTATYAEGTVTMTGTDGTVVPIGTELGPVNEITFETTEEVTIGSAETVVAIRAIDAGAAGNLEIGTSLNISAGPSGMDSAATVVELSGAADEEIDDDLRLRVLQRIQNPPMGGDQQDYVDWTLDVPGVTRAWSFPLEMGMGTVTVRFMMDALRADNDGFPTPYDAGQVRDYLDTVRPVAVKDLFVVVPIRRPVDFIVDNLSPDTTATRAAVIESARAMLRERGKPGQTIYAAWKSEAVLNAAGVISFNLLGGDEVMESNGHMPTLGDVAFV